MKLFMALMISMISISMHAQDNNQAEHRSLEFSLGYERTGFYRYQLGGASFNDANYIGVAKFGNKIPIGIRTALEIKNKNFILIGLNLNVNQTISKLINGFFGHDLETFNSVFITPSIEVGHRYYFRSDPKIVFALEHSLIFEYFPIYQNFDYFRKGSLLWKPSLRVEKKTDKNMALFCNLSYGVGLISSLHRYFTPVVRNSVGLEFGIMKPIDFMPK